MTTLTESQPTTRLSHLRAYLAGTGATGSLIVGAVVVFLGVAAFVAFHGVPFGGSHGGSGSALVGSRAVGPPERAARSLAAAPRSVAARPLPGAPVGAAVIAGTPGSAGASTFSVGTATAPSGTPTQTAPAPVAGTTGTTPSSPTSSSSGPLTNAVGGLSQATGTDLSGPTQGATQTLDSTVTGTLNQAGAAVGQGHLGDQVAGTANDLLSGGGH